MALILRLKYDSTTADGLQFTILDNTGNYNASTNPGGYGTPNPDRSDIALFLRAFTKRFDGSDTVTSTNIVATPNDTDPVATASWVVEVTAQGWHQSNLYGLQLYDVATLLSVDELVWKADTEQIVRILTRTGSGPYTYTYAVAAEADLDNTDYTTAYTAVLNSLVIPELCVCENKAIAFYFTTREASDFTVYQNIDVLLKSISASFANQDYAGAQKKVEDVENKCDCLDQTCNC